MDQTRFDALTRGLAGRTGRRQMIGAALAGGLGLLTAMPTDAARRRKRKGRRNGASDESPDQTMQLPPGTLAGGIWDETIEICHFNVETGGYDVVAVSTVLVPNYLNAGDTLYIDCCTDAECGPLPCLEPTSCVQGACAYDVVEGTPCALDNGATGYCNSNAECVVPTYPPATTAAPETTSYDPAYDTGYDTSYSQGYESGYAPATEPGS